MVLNIDKHKSSSLALIDCEGNHVTYGELAELMNTVGKKVKPRSLIFNLCKNTVGSMVGYLSFIEQEAVPVTLSAKIDDNLLTDLLNIYTPAYMWVPVEET